MVSVEVRALMLQCSRDEHGDRMGEIRYPCLITLAGRMTLNRKQKVISENYYCAFKGG